MPVFNYTKIYYMWLSQSTGRNASERDSLVILRITLAQPKNNIMKNGNAYSLILLAFAENSAGFFVQRPFFRIGYHIFCDSP